MDQNKGKKQKQDNNCAKDNGNTKDLDSEFDSVNEKQNSEEAVQMKSLGTSKNNSERRRTGRPRGRPKRDAAGDLILAEIKNSFNIKTTKLKSQRLKKTVSINEKSERSAKGDQEKV